MAESRLAVPRHTAALGWLRDAYWLNAKRVRVYGGALAIATLLLVAARIVLPLLGPGPFAAPLRADYVSFWSAGRLALAGHAAAAYDMARHYAVEQTVFPGFGYEAFFYPPVFLLLCAPMALLAFWLSCAAFIALSLFGYWKALDRLLPRAGFVFLGFPAVGVNLYYGQNGFLTAALFAAALALLPRRALLAGVCFGCLCYKPHLGLAVPIALLAAREWRAFLAAAAAVAALIGASAALFGIGAWRGFFAGAALARHTLEVGLVDNLGWESTFRAVVQAGAGVGTAYAVQGVVSLAVVAAMAAACWRRPAVLAGVLPLAVLLSTPFLLVYDLVLLAVPMAWLAGQARRGGFWPWERAALLLAYLLPLATMLDGRWLLPLGPPVMLALFAVVLRRALRMPREAVA